jgi:hypothetical protein
LLLSSILSLCHASCLAQVVVIHCLCSLHGSCLNP